MIKNITREIEPKIDKGIKVILLASIVNLIFAILIDAFFIQWIINSIFCAVVLYELFILNKNLDFIYLLDVKKEDIYNNLMINYFKISIILLSLTYLFGATIYKDYYLGISLMLPIFIFITSFLLEYILTRKIISIIKYIAVAILYLFLVNFINILFWISISYLFIKINSFVISQKKDYKFIKNNLFLNFSILLYASLFLFFSPYNHYYNLIDGTVIVNNVYSYDNLISYASIIFFLISVFIVFIVYYYFKNKYNLKAKNKFIDFFFLISTYLLLVIGIGFSPILLDVSEPYNLAFIIQIKIILSIFILILIFLSSKIKFKPKKLGEMYDKYL